MQWVNPVRAWSNYRPVVSDGYSSVVTAGHREHHGVDVMFKRKGAAVELAFPAGTPNGSRGYFMPNDVHVVAAADGLLWSSSRSPGGLQVVLDHGSPFATYYQHMTRLFVPLGVSSGKGGIRVERGQSIGIVGGSPLDGEHLMHLHFEMWKGGGSGAHVDPQAEGFDDWDIATDAGGGLEVLIVPAIAIAAAWVTGKRPAGT